MRNEIPLPRLEAEMRQASAAANAAYAAWEAGAPGSPSSPYEAFQAAYDQFARLALKVAEAPAQGPDDIAVKLRSIRLLVGLDQWPEDAIELMTETALAAVVPPMRAAA